MSEAMDSRPTERASVNAADSLRGESGRFEAERDSHRHCVQWLIIAAILAVVAGRIFALQPHVENRQSPFLSANDRSRWATIRALGDDGVYSIDHLTSQPRSIWNTIDKVVHRGGDGQIHEYSSKPTLFPTMLAYVYRAIRSVTGWSLDERPFSVARVMLLLINVIPLGLLLLAVDSVVRSRGHSTWTRSVVSLGLGLGTFLGTFSVTLNNHLPAAVSVGVGVLCVWQVVQAGDGRRASSWWWALGGLAGAFAAANELPALSFLCLLAVAFLWLDWKRTLLVFLPAAGLIACASFATNWQAHGSWRPAYAHRSDGEVLMTLPSELASNFASSRLPENVRRDLEQNQIAVSSLWTIEPGVVSSEGNAESQESRWVLTDLNTFERWALVQPTADSEIEVRAWDNWYEYPGSYWSQPRESRSSVDQGEESRAVYAWHMLLGHHGLFSLTPLFFFSLAGFAFAFRSNQTRHWRALAAAIALLSIVCFSFYLSRGLIDRNYGGQSSCLRWMLWFAPLWMLLASDAIERVSKFTWGRGLVGAALVASISSAAFSQANPWVHPWIYQWFVAQ